MPAVPIDSITLEPALAEWPVLLRRSPPGRSDAQRDLIALTRRELGLPDDRPILATGHQPVFWHCGILAKYIAVDAVVRSERDKAEGITGLHVIVDQDVVDCAAIDVPVRDGDGVLSSRSLNLASGAAAKDVPAGWLSSFKAHLPTMVGSAFPGVEDAVAQMCSVLDAHKEAPSAAAQVAGTLSHLMHACCGLAAQPVIMASDLLRTTAARQFAESIVRDSQRCAELYNLAATGHPQARITPLAVRDDVVEVPFWRVLDDHRRVRAYDGDLERWLDDPASITLLPRALSMTALLRMAVADGFVHGAGGRMYERVMEQWIKQWNPTPLGVMTTASATVRLPLMSEADLALLQGDGLRQARSRLRLVMHDPEAANAAPSLRPGPRKRQLLREVDRGPRGSVARRSSFHAMHAWLDHARVDHADQLAIARREVARLERIARSATTAMRRDWAFPLVPPALLATLVSRIRSEMRD